ncbi:hypothetical protein ASPVEDRAFT_135111 [Aspergillus versicolor CBS 583.65]|uniref:UbiA prenyltransferase n=1 Tax=Aspergillus versicolor CBS 583.65 TaxID=1036611 RepID=A0A1L9PQT4_ASPVE|nr:uncharacterized protein ASPVEDRAFT_135111 [Aspergillus versicolor CBS 583.65]OJJ03894.1 hypothetical protein ASPVEDRAFT_135111 [Aspergillus versicolor CBS 583.65]
MPTQPLVRLADLPSLLWAFTESDFSTFVLPNTGFGLLAALVAPTLTDCSEAPSALGLLLQASPRILLFNWGNLLVFDLANQRLPESVVEDAVNKPWRPLPRGQISPTQTRQLLLAAVAAVWTVSSLLGVGAECALILVLTWMYNDLHGGDELCRDLIIALAYDLYLVSSLRIALATTGTCDNVSFAKRGYQWRAMIVGVIATTMQIQDLRDQAGDRKRGRKTWPLVVGELSRQWIAGCVVCWSVVCAGFWQVPAPVAAAVVALGAWIGVCVLRGRADVAAWRVWCLWQLVLYTLPACSLL